MPHRTRITKRPVHTPANLRLRPEQRVSVGENKETVSQLRGNDNSKLCAQNVEQPSE